MLRPAHILLSLFFILFFTFALKAQNKKIDSLKLEITNAKHDSTLVQALTSLADQVRRGEPDTAIKLLLQAKKIAEKNLNTIEINNSEGSGSLRKTFLRKSGFANYYLGLTEFNKENTAKSIEYFKTSLENFKEAGYKKAMCHAYKELGNAFHKIGRTEDGISFIKQGLETANETNDKRSAIMCLNGIGVIYHTSGNVKEAIRYFERSLKMSEAINDKQSIAGTCINLGGIFAIQEQVEDAIPYFERSFKLFTEIGDRRGITIALSNLSIQASRKNDFRGSLKYLEQCLEIQKEMNAGGAMVQSFIEIAKLHGNLGDEASADKYFNMGLSYAMKDGGKEILGIAYEGLMEHCLMQGKKQQALTWAKKYYALAKDDKNPRQIMGMANELKKVYLEVHDYRSVLAMSDLYNKMRDSILTTENSQASYKSKLNYEYEKKAFADSLRISDEKKIAQAQVAEASANLKQQKTQRIALIGGLLLMLVFSVVIFNRFKKSQAQKQIIEIQKIEVDKSREKIISSINYAKKIQYSILPSSNEFNHYFSRHFVFYKPKDIVSGDLYWFHHEADLSCVAVIDCTGHGVPGAFMTMIAHSLLIEVVAEQKNRDPAKILSALHSLVFKNLQQHKGDEYSQDGMDISLAVIDHKNKLLHFSGARNNGYLIDGTEVRTMKATAKSVGGMSVLGEIEPERDFKAETFQLNNNTQIVFSTDGIFDQLNEKDEKFGNENVKKFILKLSEAEDQQQLAESTLNTWKGTAPQLDDILLLSLKL